MTTAHPNREPSSLPPVYGLVLAGGKSTRMREDKAGIEYHGIPQARSSYELLAQCCQNVFLSIREEQRENRANSGLPQIFDRFLGFGPIGGILSAMTAHPGVAWLVLACDMPFLTARDLRGLLERRNPETLATAFISPKGFPEPLCTLYEPKSVMTLHRYMAQGEYSLINILSDSAIESVEPPRPEILTNLNAPAERDAARDSLQSHRKDLP